MLPDLTAEERDAIVRVLRQTIDSDRFPLAPRLRPLKSALAKLDPPVAPARVVSASLKKWTPAMAAGLETRLWDFAECARGSAEEARAIQPRRLLLRACDVPPGVTSDYGAHSVQYANTQAAAHTIQTAKRSLNRRFSLASIPYTRQRQGGLGAGEDLGGAKLCPEVSNR
jgi:hypothetical protein